MGEVSKIVDARLVELRGTSVYLKYANVAVQLPPTSKFGERTLVIPIYKGKAGTIDEGALEDYVEKKRTVPFEISVLGNLRYPVKAGTLQAEVMQFLEFYSKSLLKDVDIYRPKAIGCDGYGPVCWFIWYDFEIDGIPCSMMLFAARKQQNAVEEVAEIPKDVRKLAFSPGATEFNVRLFIGEYSGQ